MVAGVRGEVAGADSRPGRLVRLRLDLRYDGTEFAGWAAQPDRRTVEGLLASALGQVLRLDSPSLTVAGRTDAGVHARGQVAHVDVPAHAWVATTARPGSDPGEVLVRRLRGVLPDDVVVYRCSLAPAGFDARFSASERRYVYRVADADHLRDPLRRREVLWWPRSLDVAVMAEASVPLLGEHDFLPFCRPRPQASTIRTLSQLGWARAEEGLVLATVVADAFCHHMVRALVGAILAVGDGRRPPSWPATVLAAGVRDPAVPVVPARGLTLERVSYPPDDELGAVARSRRSRRGVGVPARADGDILGA